MANILLQAFAGELIWKEVTGLPSWTILTVGMLTLGDDASLVNSITALGWRSRANGPRQASVIWASGLL